jgi:hypothetical protein
MERYFGRYSIECKEFTTIYVIRMSNEQLKRVHYTIRSLQIWTASVLVALGVLLQKGTALKDFYQFGPSDKLIILGLVINSYALYAGVVFYSFFNTVMRNLNNQIVGSWITLVVHDPTVSKQDLSHLYMYEITMMSSIYTYIDWFIYLNLVFSQLDIVLIEFAGEMFITFIVTRMYLNISPQNDIVMVET